MFGVGTVGISSAGQAGVEISVSGLCNSKQVHDLINRSRGFRIYTTTAENSKKPTTATGGHTAPLRTNSAADDVH